MNNPLPANGGDPFSALGDPNRRTIVTLLQGGERSVREIADELPISRPAVSRHLRLLKDAGIVTDRIVGNRHLCRLSDHGLDAILSRLEEMWGTAVARFRIVAEDTKSREDR